MNIKNNVKDINAFINLPNKEATKVIPETIIGTTNTAGDIEENLINYSK